MSQPTHGAQLDAHLKDSIGGRSATAAPPGGCSSCSTLFRLLCTRFRSCSSLPDCSCRFRRRRVVPSTAVAALSRSCAGQKLVAGVGGEYDESGHKVTFRSVKKSV